MHSLPEEKPFGAATSGEKRDEGDLVGKHAALLDLKGELVGFPAVARPNVYPDHEAVGEDVGPFDLRKRRLGGRQGAAFAVHLDEQVADVDVAGEAASAGKAMHACAIVEGLQVAAASEEGGIAMNSELEAKGGIFCADRSPEMVFCADGSPAMVFCADRSSAMAFCADRSSAADLRRRERGSLAHNRRSKTLRNCSFLRGV
jgi:hypothetical protein